VRQICSPPTKKRLWLAGDLGEFAGINDDDLAAVLFDDAFLCPGTQRPNVVSTVVPAIAAKS